MDTENVFDKDAIIAKKEPSFVNSGNPQWYVLHTISGYENVAKQNLELTIEKFGLQNRIFDIVIPIEEKIDAGFDYINRVLNENKDEKITHK